MYQIVSEYVECDDYSKKIYGIRSETGFRLLFTDSESEAADFAALCNENSVEENQVFDIAEDLFYS